MADLVRRAVWLATQEILLVQLEMLARSLHRAGVSRGKMQRIIKEAIDAEEMGRATRTRPVGMGESGAAALPVDDQARAES